MPRRKENMVKVRALQIENELLRNCFGRILKILEYEEEANITDETIPPHVVVDDDYWRGLERARKVIREEVTSLESVLNYKYEEGD